ncbi:hypothetical protein SAY86_025171 [Trapa natans]|uniref:Uncharacterized protein n=1 Tax=Trapa natans TaxID=22666 RepID=A0AAN7MRL2_TRANT|nr:hypothetical protein SAY86_025171 [Trapa natans]
MTRQGWLWCAWLPPWRAWRGVERIGASLLAVYSPASRVRFQEGKPLPAKQNILLRIDWEGAMDDLIFAAQMSPQDMGIGGAEKALKMSKRKD